MSILTSYNFQKCCLLLQSYYSSFEEVNMKTVVSNGETNEQEKIVKVTFTLDHHTNSTLEDRMLLYYCTICALYPCFYVDKSLSTADEPSSTNMKESSSSNSISSKLNTLMNNNSDELETTSEGLCDFVRELFSLERQVFNDYQVKVLKKLLLRKSHAQIVKEDLQKQLFVIENDLHPYYKKENFQSEACYELWKDSTHKFLTESIENFSHVQTSFTVDQVAESKYCDKLKSYVEYYERILNQVFVHLKRINRMSLTSNSKRLLREYQMRYLIDPFYTLLMELNAYLTNFEFNTELVIVIKNYLNRISYYLKSNNIQENIRINSFPVVIDDLMTLKKILSSIELSLTFFIKDLKIHYPDSKADEISNLVLLLEEMCNLNELLNRSSSLTIPELITNSLKEGLSYSYSEVKLKLKIKYFSSSELQIASNLVYSMLHFSREQLIYFKKRISDKLTKYLNVMDVVINVIYKLLMQDAKCLCEEHKDELKDSTKLNLNLLALAYRLNQFDLEWSNIIPVEKQEWRLYFLPQLINWTMAIGEMCLKTVSNLFIPNDTFNEIKLNDDTTVGTVIGKIRKTKFRSKTTIEMPTTQKNLILSKAFKQNPTTTSETTASPTITASSISSNTSGVVFSGQSAFKPFKPNLTEKRASLTNASSVSIDQSLSTTKAAYDKKDSITNFNDIIVKRHLEELLEKNRTARRYARRSKSVSCNNGKAHLLQRFDKQSSKSLPNINIKIETKSNEANKGNNILFVNNPPKSFKETFVKVNNTSSRSSTSTAATSSSGINMQLAKTKLSMLRYPCSSSIFDLVILIFRFKDVCCSLIKFIMPPSIEKMSSKFFEAKFQTALCVYRTIFQLIDTYADNLFSLDICATSEPLINKIFGDKLVNQVFSQDNLDNLWGCRHRLKNSKYNCQYYINRSSQYISDLYEPINETMCVRLNNLIQLKELYSYLNQVFKTQMQNLKQDCIEKLMKIKSTSNINNGMSVNNFKKLIANSVHEQNLIINRITLKINQITNGLVQLLVHRFNLFCKKAILTLMSDELDAYPINTRLKPLIDFLTINFEMLQVHSYQNLFQRILYILWNHFSETFNILLNNLNKTRIPRQSAHKYLQMIDLLMHQFKTYGCKVNFMESKIENIKACLQLYSHESVELIRLYYKLFNLDYRKSVEMLKKTTSFLLSDLPHLIQMKNQLKKPFNGKFFINYLRKHPPPSTNMQLFSSKRLDKDSVLNLLINYAQTLLDENYLCSCLPKRNKKAHPSTKPSDANTVNEDDDFANELIASYKSNSSPFLNATTTASLNYLNYNTIFLATKLSYFRLNENTINELVNSLLSINMILNNELQILFGNNIRFHATLDNTEPDKLLEICIENSIDYDFIINILWNRIHNEPLVMKFISLRYSNYSTNIRNNLSQLYEQQQQQQTVATTTTADDPNTILIPFFFQ